METVILHEHADVQFDECVTCTNLEHEHLLEIIVLSIIQLLNRVQLKVGRQVLVGKLLILWNFFESRVILQLGKDLVDGVSDTRIELFTSMTYSMKLELT